LLNDAPAARATPEVKMPTFTSSETRAEIVARELLTIRGWNVSRPPKGNLVWKNEYRDFPALRDALTGKGKKGRGGDGYPDFLVLDRETNTPLIVGETKAKEDDIELAITEADQYGEALLGSGLNVLAAGIAGGENGGFKVRVDKRAGRDWKPVEYRTNPIQWIPTPVETRLLLANRRLFELQPRVPSNEILAKRGDEINRILRESKIKDEFRPAIMGAFMLALWRSKGDIRTDAEHALSDINNECKKAFVQAGKSEVAESILVPEANLKLASHAARICRILDLLNITTLTSEHDYLGQLYEMFFRFTGGNTIGQFFTPRHITGFVNELCAVGRNDVILDPTCGTGGFLISALNRMMDGKHFTEQQMAMLVKDHLIGFESEPITAALCVVNMLLRGDGKTGIILGDCFVDRRYPIGTATVAVGNPPFPHKKTDDPPEKFVNRALEALGMRGQLALIVPGSQLVKGSKRKWRAKTLQDNSLRAVITLPAELFQPYAAATTAILVLEKGVKHTPRTRTFFCRIKNDGYRLKKNVRVPQPGEELTAALDAYNDNLSKAGFCIMTSIPDAQSGSEWSPGAFIESEQHSEAELKAEIAFLMRSLTSFSAAFAPHLARFDQMLRVGEMAPKPYGKSVQLSLDEVGQPNTVQALFRVLYGQGALENKENLPSGPTPVISSAGTNNGCYGFYDLTDVADVIKAPFVTVPRTGSIGEAFVQERPCGVTSDCLVLLPKEGADEADLFIAAATIRLERWRFDYGRKITPGRIANLKLNRNARLKTWIKAQRLLANNLIDQTIAVLSNEPDTLATTFKELVATWRRDTSALSVLERKTMHPAYQTIIGMGVRALPLIFRELQRNGDHWLWALRAITRDDPAGPDDTFAEAVNAWLKWGRERGYL
jgi:type I restriction enzyme M protein